MLRALERAGNRLKGRAGIIRDTLRGVHPMIAAATLGPSLVADAFTLDELIGDSHDDVVARYAVWARQTADDADQIVGELLGTTNISAKIDRQAHLDESVEYLRNGLGELTRQRLFERSLIQTGELIPSGFTRAVLAHAGGQANVTLSGSAYVALTPSGQPVPGLATGPDTGEAIRAGGGAVEAYRWVYGPATRGQPFPPHVRLDGRVFQNFDDPQLANTSGWPPYSHYIPGDHQGCRCDYEPIVLSPEAARAAGLAPKAAPLGNTLTAPDDLADVERLEQTPEPEPTPPAKPARAPESFPSNSVTYSSPAVRKKYEPTMRALDELHSVPTGVLPPTNIKAGGAATAKGGHFTPASRGPKPRRKRGAPYSEYVQQMADYRAQPLTPEIQINDRKDGTQLLTLLHEYGHRIDYKGGERGVSVLGGVSGYHSQGGSAAVAAFQEAAKATPTISEALTRYRDFGYVQYYRSPHEVWARAYSQWAANQLGGAHRAALDASLSGKYGNYQWPDDEFETLAPFVEAVLRERGMIE